MELNANLFKPEGYVGRRDYIFNFFTIGLISSFFILPYSVWSLIKLFSSHGSQGSLANYIANPPLLFILLMLVGVGLSSYLSILNIIKRVRDIFNKVNLPFVLITSVFCVLSAVSVASKNVFINLAAFIYFCISLFLMLKKGKISSNLPYDYKKDFNWGAFLGTWAWGLYNKCYIPMWHLLLLFTPWGFYYQVFCGMKGNEWAYKSKNWNDIDKFNKSQQNQTLFWAITTAVAVPFLIFAFSFCAILVSAAFFANNPGAMDNLASKIETVANNFVEQIFASYEIGNKENKYYISESLWKKSQFKDKKNYLDLAADHAATIKQKNKKKGDYSYYSKSTELVITKIYSSSDKNKLLGEFVLNTDDIKDFKSTIKASINAYRFY